MRATKDAVSCNLARELYGNDAAIASGGCKRRMRLLCVERRRRRSRGAQSQIRPGHIALSL